MLPGLQLALDILSAQIEEYREALRALQMVDTADPVKPKRGRPRKAIPEITLKPAKKSSGIKAYWARMTPKQRAAEMNRRHARRAEKARTKVAAAA